LVLDDRLALDKKDYFRLQPKLKGPFWDSFVDIISQDHLAIKFNCQSGSIVLQNQSYKPTLIMHNDDNGIINATSSNNLLASCSTSSWTVSELNTCIRIGPFDLVLEHPWLGAQYQATLQQAYNNMLADRRDYHTSHRLGLFFIMQNLRSNRNYLLQPNSNQSDYLSSVHTETGDSGRIVTLEYNQNTYRSVRRTIGNLRRLGGEAQTGLLGHPRDMVSSPAWHVLAFATVQDATTTFQ
jgi:hypothetical protein